MEKPGPSGLEYTRMDLKRNLKLFKMRQFVIETLFKILQ